MNVNGRRNYKEMFRRVKKDEDSFEEPRSKEKRNTTKNEKSSKKLAKKFFDK